MGKLLGLVLSKFFLLFEGMKGLRYFEQAEVFKNTVTSIKVMTMGGFTITIHIKETKWLCRYKHPLIPNKYYGVFHIYSEASHDCPEKIKKACKLKIDLPWLMPWFVDEFIQKQVVVQAYIDLLKSNMDSE